MSTIPDETCPHKDASALQVGAAAGDASVIMNDTRAMVDEMGR